MSLIIFDKDSTLIKPIGPNENLPASKPSEQILYDGVKEKCDQLRKDGHILAIASNQGGVAFGLVSRENAIGMMKDASDKIGAALFALCACHPKGEVLGAVRNSPYRKPGPGMIQYLMDALGFAPQDTIYVGDLDTDRQAALAANVKFEWANDFFGRSDTPVAEVATDSSSISDDNPGSTIAVEEPFPDDDEDYEDEDDDDEEEEDYWDQWQDDDDDSSNSDDGNIDDTGSGGDSAGVYNSNNSSDSL